MNHEGVLIAHHGPLPQGLAQGVDGDDVSPVGRQLFEQGVLLGGEGSLTAAGAAHRAGAPVHLRCPEAQHLPRPSAVHPAEHRRQAQQQLLRQEGLGDVVVRPQAQPPQASLILVPCGEEQHRHAVLHPPQLLQQGKPVPIGEHHVQQRRVGLRLCPRPAGLGAVGCQCDSIARPLQQLSHHAPQLRRVVHQ